MAHLNRSALTALSLGVSLVAAATALQSCKDLFPDKQKNIGQAQGLKLLWVSLDGLKKSDLEAYLPRISSPRAKGVRYLLERGNWNPGLTMTNPTITYASHISTITCTPPGVHGIIANSQWNGKKMGGGFSTPYNAESFITRLKDAGLKVASYGYPGIDGEGDSRSSTLGGNYDGTVNDAAYFKVAPGAEGNFEVPSRMTKDLKHNVTYRVSEDGKQITYTTPFGGSFTQTTGLWQDVVFSDPDDAASHKQRVLFLYKAKEGAEGTLYVSPVGLSNAFPEEFAKKLDARGLVFSPAKDYGLPGKMGADAYVQAMTFNLRHFTDVAKLILDEEKPDAFFYYLEDLDTLGHQFAGQPQYDDLRGQALSSLDIALDELFSRVPDSANVVVLGDHGMSAINYELNVNAILGKDILNKWQVSTSGGSVFLYGKETELNSQPATQEPWFVQAVDRLQQATVPFDGNRKVFAKVVVKGTQEAKDAGLDGESMPWVMAFAAPSIGIRKSIESSLLMSMRQGFPIPEELRALYPVPMNSGRAVEPVPMGQHGHLASTPEMQTSLVMFGPQFDGIKANDISLNTGLVPQIADSLGWPRPSGCAK